MEPVPNILSTLPSIPKSVEIWLERVLAKDPDDRFSDANEMSIALQAAMQGKAPPALTKTVVAPSWSEETTKQNPIIVSKYPARSEAQQIQSGYADPSTQAHPDAHTFPPAPTTEKRQWVPWLVVVVILLGIGAIVTFGLVFSGTNGKGPLAFLERATATQAVEYVVAERTTDTPIPEPIEEEAEIVIAEEETPPTLTSIPPTPTQPPLTPTLDPTEEPGIPILGGADKIAFLNANEIFMMNVDGSDLQQLTNDRAEKTNLGWFPDGSALSYISGKCIWYIDIESTGIDTIACFESAEYLEHFSFSPDGSQVAISVNRELYIVPWDLNQLQNVRYNRDLAAMSDCPSLAPFRSLSSTEPVKEMRWANDDQRIIILKLANVQGKLGDLIQIYDFQSCDFPPNRVDEIPASRFDFEDYNENLRIENFSFDGDILLALISYTRNGGYGHLYIYNTNARKVDSRVNPINGECCYRDPKFSPDGRFIIFVYQPYEADARSYLYYIPYGSIGTGANYEPIPLPESFFENPRGKPQPVLRPVQ